MICKFRETLRKYNMLKEKDAVVIGLSGGADSMALLNAMMHIRDELSLKIYAAHINHNLRGDESKRDENFVRDVCKKFDIELRVLSVDVMKIAKDNKESIETCGRKIRYDFFGSFGENMKICTAHTLSDSEETFLFNLIRGTGLKGLCSIPAVRGNIIRPLIECTREDVENFCNEKQIEYITDSTNLLDDYTRNNIRLNIIPLMKKINPSFDQSLLRCIDNLKIDENYIYKNAEIAFEKCYSGNNEYIRSVLMNEHPAIVSRVIAKIIKKECGKNPTKKHTQIAMDILLSGGKAQITGGKILCSENDKLFFEKEKDIIQNPSIPLRIGEIELPLGKLKLQIFNSNDENIQKVYKQFSDNAIDYDKMKGIVLIRSKKDGDMITLPKRNVTKKIKKLFNEDQVTEEKRALLPLISDDDSVVWLSNYGTDKKYQVTKDTKNILLVEFKENDK